MLRPVTLILPLLAVACSSGPPAGTSTPTQVPPTALVTPAPVSQAPNPTPTAAQPTPPAPTATAAATATPVAEPTAAAGATTFHLVMEDGPRAGTWDVSSEHPTSCAYVSELDKWTISYLGPPPVSFIDGGLAEEFPTLLMTFESDTPDVTYFRAIDGVTYDVDDRGTTATISISVANLEAEDASGEETQAGPAELTVECAAPFRYE